MQGFMEEQKATAGPHSGPYQPAYQTAYQAALPHTNQPPRL